MENSCKWHRTAIGIVCIVSAVLVIASYVFYNSNEAVNNSQQDEISQNGANSPVKSSENATGMNTVQIIRRKVKKVVISRPTFPYCARGHIVTVFAGILHEFHVKQTMCTDIDFEKHNLNNDENDTTDEDGKVTRGVFVVYVAIVLLLVSLIAAFLEVYKARKTTTRSRDKPELSRRCSLADLTVLRHNRRESMMRRDSVLHMSFDSATSSHRLPLKLLGAGQSDRRRGSLPVPKVKPNKWQRSMSADKADETCIETHHRIHIIRHH